jgi:hypothetical protein
MICPPESIDGPGVKIRLPMRLRTDSTNHQQTDATSACCQRRRCSARGRLRTPRRYEQRLERSFGEDGSKARPQRQLILRGAPFC